MKTRPFFFATVSPRMRLNKASLVSLDIANVHIEEDIMFADFLSDSGWSNHSHRGWTTLISFALQALAVGCLLLLPFLQVCIALCKFASRFPSLHVFDLWFFGHPPTEEASGSPRVGRRVLLTMVGLFLVTKTKAGSSRPAVFRLKPTHYEERAELSPPKLSAPF